MHHIIKIIMILLIELNIYYCIGYAMQKIKFFPPLSAIGEKFISGFLGYHVIFLLVALPFSFLDKGLDSLTIFWIVVISILMLGIFIWNHKGIKRAYGSMVYTAWKYRFILIPCLLLVAFFIYYVSVNGQVDIDARTYIGTVTTKVDTNRLVGIQPTSGQEYAEIELKRSFEMFGTNSAVLCRIFSIRPLVFCRTVRAAINIILLAVISFELLKWVYRRYEDKIEHATMVLMISISSLFFFQKSIYTRSSFILYRAYEGKAYCAGAFILLSLYLAIKLCKTKDKRYFVLIFIEMLAGMSISTSAIFILPVVVGSVVGAYILVARKWNYIVLLFFSLMPNILYAVSYIMGFTGFGLEG